VLNAQTGPVLLAYCANAALAELIDAATAAKALFSVPGPNDVVHTVWPVAAQAKKPRSLAAHPGQEAQIHLLDGSPTLRGHVVSIARGITDADNTDGPRTARQSDSDFRVGPACSADPAFASISMMCPRVC
jgi:hypothetical protein